MGLNYRDVRAVANSRFWRRRSRETILWVGFLAALIGTSLILVRPFTGGDITDVFRNSVTYTSESGQIVTITGSNVRLDGELLERESPTTESKRATADWLIGFSPLLVWAGIVAGVYYKANKFKDTFAYSWERTKEIPDPED